MLVADAGYWHQQQMERIVDRGIQVLIPPDAKSRKGTRPGWDGGLYAFMRRVLATERGGELYGQRQAIIEPVFANTKFNRGIDRFRRRGRAAVRAEWRLITATHNLLKLHRHATRPPEPPPALAAAAPAETHPSAVVLGDGVHLRLTRQPRLNAVVRSRDLRSPAARPRGNEFHRCLRVSAYIETGPASLPSLFLGNGRWRGSCAEPGPGRSLG